LGPELKSEAAHAFEMRWAGSAKRAGRGLSTITTKTTRQEAGLFARSEERALRADLARSSKRGTWTGALEDTAGGALIGQNGTAC
jgi:hypothetical protein